MPILLLLIVGAAVGFLATHFMGLKTNALISVAIGILGAILGGFVLRALVALFSGPSSLLGLFVGGFLGAVAIIWIYRRYLGK